MQLKSKVVGIILAGFLFYALFELCIQRFVIFPSFVSLEREEAARDSMRVSLAIEDELRHLHSLCNDWATWDDTYKYAVSRHEAYEKSNLIFSSFSGNHLNLIHIYDTNNNIIWGESHDLETGKPLPLAEFRSGSPPPALIPKPEHGPPLSASGISGVLTTEKGPMLVSSRPILTGDGRGPSHGTLVMGRLLTEETVQMLADQTKIPFDIIPVLAADPAPSLLGILARFDKGASCLVEPVTSKMHHVYRMYTDINGELAFLTRAEFPRSITSLGTTTLNHAVRSSLSAGFILLVTALLFMKQAILAPLGHLTSHVMRVGQSGDLTERLTVSTSDEIGTLSDEFNKMLQSLANMQGKLTEQTRSNNRLQHALDEHKRFEQALRKYESIISSSTDQIALIGRDFSFLFVNDSLVSAYDTHPAQLIGRPIMDFVDRDFFDRELKGRFESCLSGETIRFNVWLDYPTLGRRNKDVACFPLNEDNAMTGIVIYSRDMTDTKKMEEHLFKAQKMDAIGTLAGGIAHDFNNILMAISGRISLLLFDSDSASPLHQHLKEMEKCVNSASTLTRQLLGYARGGKNQVKPTDLNALIRTGADMFGRTRKEIRIQTRLHEGLWSVEADPSQLDQVLLNLYMNAGQAMPGGGDLSITTHNVILDDNFLKPGPELPDRYVKISVTDSGVGMDPDTQKRIFEPFFTTKSMGADKGTGLGLASAYGIVKNHNGIIEVSSKQGKGTTFRIYLPASEKAPLEDVQYDSPALKGDETILLVDDEAFVAEVGKQFLLKLGYNVILASNGEQCLDLYKKNRHSIALVILDLVMPGMGGGEIYDRLKAMDPDVRVLLTSGYSPGGKTEEIMARGCNGFIQKPMGVEELSRKLRDILDEPAPFPKKPLLFKTG